MRKDKSFVKARSRGVDLGSEHTDSQGEKDPGEEGERDRGSKQMDMGEE